MVGWEATGVDVVVCLVGSTVVEIDLWGVVSVKWIVESLCGILVSFRLFNCGSMSPVILLEHLFVNDFIVVSLSLDHSSLWFEIWSSVILVLQMIFWHVCVTI
jgi:hypothetical protein